MSLVSNTRRPVVDGWKQKWHKPDQKQKIFFCHICRKDTRHDLFLSLVNIDPSRQLQDVYSCLVCKIIVIEGEKRNYPTNENGVNRSLYNMPGLEIMNLSGSLACKYNAKTFLDVGAGFGFATDIAKYCYGLDAEGIEPTDANLRAKKHFGVKITEGYMTPVTNLGRKFDYIHSSEVLEHVPDPLVFIQALYDNLTSMGLLFMTTPWAGVVNPEIDSGVLIRNLSADDHIYLWNKSAVAKLLKQVGFKEIYIELRDGHHLFILASKSTLKKKLNLIVPDNTDMTLAYMIKRSRTARSRIAQLSMLTAAFFLANDKRDYNLCVKLLPRLLRSTKSFFGIDIKNPDKAKPSQINNLGDFAPRIAALCYVISTIYILYTIDYDKAILYCRLADAIIKSNKPSTGYGEYISTLHEAVLDTLELAKQNKKSSQKS